jgi:predicted small lipoprotein YifL
MRRVRLPVFACLALLSIAACGRRDPVADENAAAARAEAALPTVNKPVPDADGAPPPSTAPATKPVAARVGIPTALQGRWGLTPADCVTTRGDAKGLLIITGDRLSFYESRAIPAAGLQTSPDSISGNFDYTGEGQTWTKYQSLKLADGKLVRTESKPTASFTYARC